MGIKLRRSIVMTATLMCLWTSSYAAPGADQMELVNIAQTDSSVAARAAAVKKLESLAKMGDVSVAMEAIALLTNRAFLSKWAQSGDRHFSQIAKLRLFLMDPFIEGQLGVTQIVIKRNSMWQGYSMRGSQSTSAGMLGEDIRVTVERGET